MVDDQMVRAALSSWGIGLDPERESGKRARDCARNRVLLVVPNGQQDNPLVWTLLGFSEEQSRRIAENDDWMVVNAPRPLQVVGCKPIDVDVETSAGTTHRRMEYLDGEEVKPRAGSVYPDAPNGYGRFYVAGDPTWLRNSNSADKTIWDSWMADDAWPVLVVTPAGIERAVMEELIVREGSRAKADAMLQDYRMTLSEIAKAQGYPRLIEGGVKN